MVIDAGGEPLTLEGTGKIPQFPPPPISSQQAASHCRTQVKERNRFAVDERGEWVTFFFGDSLSCVVVVPMKCLAFHLLAFGAFFALTVSSSGMDVILNEYNAVGSSRWLDEDELDGSDKSDTRMGRIEGNGGNWFELAVVGDGTNGSTVDMRNWRLSWTEGDDNGEIVLTSDDFWSSVRAGTLVTIAENEIITAQDGSEVVNGSDAAIDFSIGDNWVHLHAADRAYIASTSTNVADDLDDIGNPIFGRFSVGNDDWQLTIIDDTMTSIFGPIGEGADGIDAGVGSREVLKLEANVSASVDLATYNDGTTSTFGAANVWSSDDVTMMQDFSSFGVVPEPSNLLLLLLGLSVLGIFRRR